MACVFNIEFLFISGVVDKILTEMKRNVFDKIAGKKFMDAFFKKVDLGFYEFRFLNSTTYLGEYHFLWKAGW